MLHVQTVAAHSQGGVSSLVAHSVAPLLATGTTNQVVKVWTDQCEVVSALGLTAGGCSPENRAGLTSCAPGCCHKSVLKKERAVSQSPHAN